MHRRQIFWSLIIGILAEACESSVPRSVIVNTPGIGASDPGSEHSGDAQVAGHEAAAGSSAENPGTSTVTNTSSSTATATLTASSLNPVNTQGTRGRGGAGTVGAITDLLSTIVKSKGQGNAVSGSNQAKTSSQSATSTSSTANNFAGSSGGVYTDAYSGKTWPYCRSASSADSAGDGWGWEADPATGKMGSCKLAATGQERSKLNCKALDTNAGPLNSLDHATSTCPNVCKGVSGTWNGQWTTLKDQGSSVCGCMVCDKP